LERFVNLNVLVNNAGIMREIDPTGDTFDCACVEQGRVADLYAPIDLPLHFLPTSAATATRSAC
jgi:short-subunit dehydrogenase involved in D-alanine esterification of teichoic acids